MPVPMCKVDDVVYFVASDLEPGQGDTLVRGVVAFVGEGEGVIGVRADALGRDFHFEIDEMRSCRDVDMNPEAAWDAHTDLIAKAAKEVGKELEPLLSRRDTLKRRKRHAINMSGVFSREEHTFGRFLSEAERTEYTRQVLAGLRRRPRSTVADSAVDNDLDYEEAGWALDWGLTNGWVEEIPPGPGDELRFGLTTAGDTHLDAIIGPVDAGAVLAQAKMARERHDSENEKYASDVVRPQLERLMARIRATFPDHRVGFGPDYPNFTFNGQYAIDNGDFLAGQGLTVGLYNFLSGVHHLGPAVREPATFVTLRERCPALKEFADLFRAATAELNIPGALLFPADEPADEDEEDA